MKRVTTLLLASLFTVCSAANYADTTATTAPVKAKHSTKKKHAKKSYSDTKGLELAAEPAKPAEQPASPLTGNFGLVSNYMFRGVSQSNNLPAVQGGLTYTFLKPGIYFSLWGSNVNFPDPYGTTATAEFDYIAGITNTIGENFTYDVNIDRYNYPKTAASYNEFIANAAFYFLTAQLAYSSNVFNLHANGTYYNIGFKYDIPPKYFFHLEQVNIKGGIGRYNLPSSVGLKSYDDYNLQISKTIGSYVLAVQWTDTNGQSVDPAPLRNGRLVGMVTVNF